MSILIKNNDAYSNYLVKDFKRYERHIYFKDKPILKDGLEEFCGSMLNIKNCDLKFDDIVTDQEDKTQTCLPANNLDESERIACIRAKNKIHACACLNTWDYFVTLTFDPKQIDSTDKDAVYKFIVKWIRNNLTKHNIKYLLVPEYHADRKKIHLHGFLKDNPDKPFLKLKDTSKRSRTGFKVYNLMNWKIGFSTVSIIAQNDNDVIKIANYCNKYVTKNLNDRIFKRRYFVSKGLINEPQKKYLNVIPDDLDSWYFNGICYIKDVPKD